MSHIEHNPLHSPARAGEAIRSPEVNPTLIGQKLTERYEQDFDKTFHPEVIRFATDHEEGDVNVYSATTAAELAECAPELRATYIYDQAIKATQESWWCSVDEQLYLLSKGYKQNDSFQIVSKHACDFEHRGVGLDQGYDIFDVGKPSSQANLQTVVDTIEIIDQFSGGLMSSDGTRPRILMLNNDRMGKPNHEFLALYTESSLLINVLGLTERAELAGIGVSELLATVLVHEILGHMLEDKIEGDTGVYFDQHFNYSQERVASPHYDSVHVEISPKDPTKYSQHMMEYGRVNAAEDFATSVEATIGEAMGLTESTDKIPWFKQNSDAYRQELVAEIMTVAADKAAHDSGTPGFVGSEIKSTYNHAGEAIGTERLRTMKVTTTDGETALRTEMDRVIAGRLDKHDLVVKVNSQSDM